MTFTTEIEALEALSKVKATQTDILAFVRQLSVDVGLPNNAETVLYTGKIGDTEAYKFVNDMPDTIRKLDDRALATRVLKSPEFIEKVAQAFGDTLDARDFYKLPDKHTARIWMKEGGNTPWGVISEKFVNETTGPIRVLAIDPDPTSVQVRNEWKAALDRLHVGKIPRYIPPLEQEISEFLKQAQETLRTGFGKIGKWMAIGVIGVLTACGEVDLKWSEEVQLDDGQIIVVKRTAKGEKQGELGGPGGWEEKEMSIALEKAAEGQAFPIWQTAYVPILLDYQASARTWSVVATFYYCTGWYNLGRPKLPYVEYQSKDGGPWTVVPLEERLIGRKTNLLTGPRSGGEPSFLSLQDKKGRGDNAEDRFRRIVSSWRLNFC